MIVIMAGKFKAFRPRIRFRLRGAAIVIALICMPLAAKVNQVRNQRMAVAAAREHHGVISYGAPTWSPPQWFKGILADDYFTPVVAVYLFGSKADDATIGRIAQVISIEELSIDCHHVTDAGMRQLARLKRLKRLSITSSKVTAAGLGSLADLRLLDDLRLETPRLDDSQLECIPILSQVSSLELSNMPHITDEGVRQIAAFKNLRRLTLRGVPVTDAGLLHLQGMTHLQEFRLGGARESIDGVGRLHRSRPDLQITWW